MSVKRLLGRIFGSYLVLNLLAMALVVVLLLVGVYWWLGAYTHHGEAVAVPDLYGMDYRRALELLESKGLYVQPTDSGYNKQMPAGCVLAQTPVAGSNVKAGRTVLVTINAKSSPLVAIPDLVDNSSYREAQAKLQALGFRLLPPRLQEGEKDWVIGLLGGGRSLHAGDMVSIDTPLTLVIGNGAIGEDADDMFMDDDFDDEEATDNAADDFEEVTETDF